MTPIVAYHATNLRHREGIRRFGLLPSQPAKGRPFGVYVFNDEFSHPVFSRGGRVSWDSGRGQDLWQVAYIGPLTTDQYVLNGLVLLRPAQCVTLVTGNK